MSGRISARDIAWLDEALAAHRQKNSRRYRPEFFVPMIPPTATHQEKKWRVVNGKPVPYEPDEVKAARSKLMAHLAGHKPERPLEGGIRLLKCLGSISRLLSFREARNEN